MDLQRPRRLVSGAISGRRSTVAVVTAGRKAEAETSPIRRSRARAEARTKWAAGLAAYLAAML